MKFKIEKLESYIIMPNYHLKDKNISLKAKGLLSVFYNLPNDWEYNINGICKITNTGITAIRNIIAELELNGYITRLQEKDEKGKFVYTYIIRIKPIKKSKDNVLSLKRLKQNLK